jgi:hypothetical protein
MGPGGPIGPGGPWMPIPLWLQLSGTSVLGRQEEAESTMRRYPAPSTLR